MNIKIAICDDEAKQTQYVKSVVGNWAEQNRVQIQTDMFDSAENFKLALADNKDFDILLLDIQMGGQNGVELAKDLRKTDEKLIIIFITALPDFIYDGYDVSALHYLMKPVQENKLRETLDKAYKNLTQAKKFLIINSDGKDYRILFDDILYIESLKHYVKISTSDGKEYETRRNIGDIENELDNSFFKCQRSYIVMLKHIQYISKNDVLLDNGKTISLSRNIYKDLYSAFIKYFKGKEEENI
ncbi:MAG: LytTR family DNA-binding domain-containing protein [Oscillospiraceae bacterium]|nr:LytTR family DNA-binding domain-containing protein [Oscillospiraceae bacterium]